jgi:putative ABC transport system substrate-binding protein
MEGAAARRGTAWLDTYQHRTPLPPRDPTASNGCHHSYRYLRRRCGERMRRQLLALLVIATAWPLTLQAQWRIPVLGWVGFATDSIAREGLKKGLRELGYVEGQNILMQYRFADRTNDFGELVEELVRQKVDVILAAGHPAALAAQRAALAIPIVTVVADPIGSGFAASLAHPGGNMTGLSLGVEKQFGGKWLQLLKEAAPQVTRVAYLWNPTNQSSASSWNVMQGLALQLGLTLQSVELRDPKDLGDAFAAMIRGHAAGIIVDSDAIMGPITGRIAEFASMHQLPTISMSRQFADVGGLMSYGPNVRELWQQAATYVDKILRGAKAASLPIAQPTKLYLVVNLKTAQALGLTLPPSILVGADEVIQ